MKAIFYFLLTFTSTIICENFVIVTATIGENYKKSTFTGLVSKFLYCQKHGYDFYILDDIIDVTRPLAWQKILITQQLLKDYNYVFWSDGDSLIMNQNLRLEDVFDLKTPHDFHVCFDHDVCKCLNSGQFLIRKTEKSFAFLEAVYNRDEDIFHPFWEQKAIIEVLKTGAFPDIAKYYPMRAFNSLGNKQFSKLKNTYYKVGDFIVHFPSERGILLERYMKTFGKTFILKDPNSLKIPYNVVIKN